MHFLQTVTCVKMKGGTVFSFDRTPDIFPDFLRQNRMCGHLYGSDSTKNQDPKRAMKTYLFMRQK